MTPRMCPPAPRWRRALLRAALLVILALPSAPLLAEELVSASFRHRGGAAVAAGAAALTSTAPMPSFQSSGVSIGQSEAIGLSGSSSDLGTSATGFWPQVAGALPSLDPDADQRPNFLDDDDDGDGLLDSVETGTGEFLSPSNTGTGRLDPDSDGDGFPDGIEVALGSDPTNAASFPCGPELPALPGWAWAVPALLLLTGWLFAIRPRADSLHLR